MKIDLSFEAPHMIVYLSERNLLALLTKISQPGSARTLTTNNIWIDDELAPFALALVVAEEDDEHYKSREPGELHPLAEDWLRLKGVRVPGSDEEADGPSDAIPTEPPLARRDE